MTEELKARIAQINAGTAPAGYKKTKVGIVPEEWDYKPFEEYASVKSKKYNPITDCADYPCIEMEHLQQKTGTLLGTVSSKLQASIKNLFECGDILYGKLRPYLRKYYLAEFNGVCSTEIWVLRAKKSVSNLFLYYTIQSERFNGLCDTSCIGSKMPRADWDYVSQHLFAVPPLPEQQKIAEILTAQDAVIALMQKQIELLKQQKKGFLQKMFPKKGCNVPEIRFVGFTDAWEQRKLGEISESFEYGLNAAATEYDGKHKYIRITDIDDSTHLFIQDNLTSPDIDFSTADDYLLQAGDVLFARTGASVGKTYIYRSSDGDLYFAGFLIRAKIKRDYDADFVFQNTLTDNYDSYIRITSQRSGQPGVNAQEYANFALSVPCLAEQKKIGAYFTNLDNLITLHQRKLEIEQQKKKALMQLLLTGKVRVKT